MSAADELVFAVNGSIVRIPAADVCPSKKLAHYIRDTLQLKGTKIGCGEGGCGACSVLLSRWDSALERVVTVSANGCLRPLTSVHGFMVTTVEGIGGVHDNKKPVHPIQKRFAQLNASQCGFCTPGFVVSVYSQLCKKPTSSMLDLEEALDGNLCRCTGYRPILDAAKSFAADSDVQDAIGKTQLDVSGPGSIGADIQAALDAAFPAELKSLGSAPASFRGEDGRMTIRAASTAAALAAAADAARKDGADSVAFVVSQTSAGVYKDHLPQRKTLIDLSGISELRSITPIPNGGVRCGAAVPISTFMGALLDEGARVGGATAEAFAALVQVIGKIANVHVRDVGSIGGNLLMAKNLGFASDLATPLCAANATANYVDSNGRQSAPLYDFLQQSSSEPTILETIDVRAPSSGSQFYCYRQAIRCINAHAILNSGFSVRLDSAQALRDVVAVFGAAGEFDQPGKNAPRRHAGIEAVLEGKTLQASLLDDVRALLAQDDAFIHGPYKRSHRQKLMLAFTLKFLEDLLSSKPRPAHVRSLHTAAPTFTAPTDVSMAPVGEATPRLDGVEHATGAAVYVSDVKESKDALYLAWVLATVPKGTIDKIPVEVLQGLRGSPQFYGPEVFDATRGMKNEVFNMVAAFMPLPCLSNFPVISSGAITWHGQPIGAVAADSLDAAQAAAKVLAAAVTYNADPSPVITCEDAAKAASVFMSVTPRNTGDVAASSSNDALLHASFTASLNSQKHFYMETHAAYAEPHDQHLTVHVSSQGQQFMAPVIAYSLGKQIHDVQVKQHRVGGSFGAKLAAEHAIMASAVALRTNRPVKFHLDRNTDMRFQGGRQETVAKCSIDFTPDGRIEGLIADCGKNCGDRFDWSSFGVLMLLPSHISSLYDIPNLKVVSTGYKTNTVTRAAVRAPGEIEASFITEEIIDRVAFALGVHSQVVREKNFKQTVDHHQEEFTFPEMYKALMDGGWRQRIANSIEYNTQHKATKRGVAVTPFKYHLGCRKANAHINIYADGSVLVHHCGVEMGQGLIIKVLQAAAYELSKVAGPLPLTLFKSAGNDTFALPHGGITGGSTGSEGNVMAVINAASVLVERLKPIADSMPANARSWSAVCRTAMMKGIELSATGNIFAPPPAAYLEYDIYCCGAAEIELDTRTGQLTVLRVDIKYDAARSLNPAVDIGQAEGAFLMGLGYLTLEDAGLDTSTGCQSHDGTWEYKIPTVQDVPREFNVELIHNESFTRGIMSSKASGEPPLCVATCITSAVRQAVASARQDAGIQEYAELTTPWTCDKLAVACGTCA